MSSCWGKRMYDFCGIFSCWSYPKDAGGLFDWGLGVGADQLS